MSEVALQQDFLGAFGVLERDACVLLAANRRRLDPRGEAVRTFDLPGGRVEPGELLEEALIREWREETSTLIKASRFLFVQEGLRFVDAKPAYAWRSFFFEVEVEVDIDGSAGLEPMPASEVEGLLWVAKSRLHEVLRAPYHAGYLRFLDDGKPYQL
ncbi:MAG TPA: NUDIX hydrolase, partial [Planctomycetota bacterium]|nr:NUDIX hydrolase [Planctomycetota bacterium]